MSISNCLLEYDSNDYAKFCSPGIVDKAMNSLEGVLKGIAFDNKINIAEVEKLRQWCILYADYEHRSPFKEITFFINQCLEDDYLTSEEIEDILWLCNSFKASGKYYGVITSDIQKLHGILVGVLSDGIIADDEVLKLNQWLKDNNHLVKTYPYEELCSILSVILDDKIIDETEKQLLKEYFGQFIDPSINIGGITSELKQVIHINGICSVNPDIVFHDKRFCFTGASQRTTRSALADIVTSYGGTFVDSVNKKLDYLVIGDNGNPCWAYTCYGRKVEQAISLRKEGCPLLVIHENDFWNAIENSY
jgi:hypothetical protein